MTDTNILPTSSTTPGLPFIPNSAPFTGPQRAWLNGFLAGLFSHGSGTTDDADTTATSATILFGTETGNSAKLARRLAKDFEAAGFRTELFDMAAFPTDRLPCIQNLIIIVSTYGDGEPASSAQSFHAWLHGETAPRIESTRFAVFALGDSNYVDFCQCGKDFDARLKALGGTRIMDRVDCDVEFDESFEAWKPTLMDHLRSPSETTASPAAPVPEAPPESVSAEVDLSLVGLSPNSPVTARLTENRLLNGEGSEKETRHLVLSLGKDAPAYEPGDALGVLPVNCPSVVEGILRALNFDGEEAVTCPNKEQLPLRLALQRHYEIRKPSLGVAKALADRAPNSKLAALLASGDKAAIKRYLEEREILDLLVECPGAVTRPADLTSLLKKLAPRLYSISSSPTAHSGEVHLTVGVVRYRSRERECKGVCSTFLGERAADENVSVYIHRNDNFRLPDDPSTDIIMIGPGTGIAPFRAFLEHRRETQASGRNWLFFGDRNSATDFLYRDELERFQKEGTLTRLDLAFSRDQREKVYVQHRMKDQARELWAWLQNGAHLYICGDASRMAKDVETALHEIAIDKGTLSSDAATNWLAELKSTRRYQRDVY